MSVDPSIQQAIDSAFKDTPYTLTYTQTDSEANETKLFILKSSAYYNIQAYLTVGLTLPPTVDRFQSDFPKGDLKALTELDSNVYDELKNCFVNIFTHCHDFEINSMGKFTTVTASIISFCDDAGKYIGGKGLLKDQMAVLIDENVSPTDPVFIKAAKMSQAILNTLSTRARLREADCDDLVSRLQGLLAVTRTDKTAADSLYQKFIKPGVDGKPPYSDTLQAKLAELRRQAADLTEQYQEHKDEYNHDVVVAATAVTYIGIWPFGTIAGATVMGVYSDRAIKAKEAYMKAQQDLLENGDVQAALTRCLDHVTHICTELTNITAVVTAAIEALVGMKNMFARLKSDFQGIAEKMGSIAQTLQEDDPFLRALAEVDLSAAVSQWAEIKILALDFMINAPLEWKGAVSA